MMNLQLPGTEPEQDSRGIVQKSKDLLHAKLDESIDKAKGLMNKEVEKVSIDYDPWATGHEGYYKTKPTRVSYLLLDTMSKRNSIVASILITRMNQIASFSERQKTKYDLGYILELKDQDKEVGDNEKKEMEELYSFIEHCGFPETKPADEKMDFDEFLRRIVKDRLTYDIVAVEKVRSITDEIRYFAPVDGKTIRFASKKEEIKVNTAKTLVHHDPKRELKDIEKDEDFEYAYVQVIDGQIQRVFTRDDLIVKMANVTNDVKARGYSVSELELLISTITSHLNSESYRKKMYTQGHVNKGILHFKANISQRKLNMFKKGWYAQTSGVANMWRTPILAGMDEVKWIDLGQGGKDPDFNMWMEYCIKLICAIYLIDPSEINFDISQGNSSGGNPLFTSKNEHKIKQSKDRGLRPLLRFIEDIVNNIIGELNEKYQFKFVGLDQETKKDENDRHKIELESYRSTNEIRQENNLEPIDMKFKVGDQEINPFDLPANNTVIQLLQSLISQSSMDQGGDGDFTGGDEYEDDDANDQEDYFAFDPTGQKPNAPSSNIMGDYDSTEEFGKSKKIEMPKKRQKSQKIKIEFFEIKDDKSRLGKSNGDRNITKKKI